MLKSNLSLNGHLKKEKIKKITLYEYFADCFRNWIIVKEFYIKTENLELNTLGYLMLMDYYAERRREYFFQKIPKNEFKFEISEIEVTHIENTR